MNLLEEINILSNCKPTNIPFINLFLDARKTESGMRNCDRFLNAKYDFLHYEFLISGGNNHSYERSWKMIKDVLEYELLTDTKGLILILRPGPEGEFVFIKQFKVPIDNKIIVDGIPQICHLIELINQKNISN